MNGGRRRFRRRLFLSQQGRDFFLRLGEILLKFAARFHFTDNCSREHAAGVDVGWIVPCDLDAAPADIPANREDGIASKSRGTIPPIFMRDGYWRKPLSRS